MFSDARTNYNVIGTVTAPVTLTADLADNRKTFLADRFRNLHLDITFTPGANNQFLILLVEFSNEYDASGPTNFYPMVTQNQTAGEIEVFADNGTGVTGSGIPIVFPGDKTTTSGTAVSGGYDFEINSGYVRISVRDSGSADFGTCFVKATLLV